MRVGIIALAACASSPKSTTPPTPAPGDLWTCTCACDDRAGGPPFEATVLGCAPIGLSDQVGADRDTACSTACMPGIETVQGLDPHATRVEAVMTPDPVIVYANETVEAAMRIVTERRCRQLPVFDETGLCGLVSIGDLTKWVVGDQRRTIEDLHAYIQRA